jgi:hypothetical protein
MAVSQVTLFGQVCPFITSNSPHVTAVGWRTVGKVGSEVDVLDEVDVLLDVELEVLLEVLDVVDEEVVVVCAPARPAPSRRAQATPSAINIRIPHLPRVPVPSV